MRQRKLDWVGPWCDPAGLFWGSDVPVSILTVASSTPNVSLYTIDADIF